MNHSVFRISSVYRDEPEDGEEVSEEKDTADEDIFTYKSSTLTSSDASLEKGASASATPSPTRKPMKKIDLGAAATLVSVAQTAKSQATENGSALQQPNDKKNTSAMNDLVDLMNTGPTDAPLVPGNVSAEPDLFGNFSSAQPAGNTKIFLTPEH